ncbi:MAG: STAS domain-containing protein [Planctomycetota bacterium]
MHISVEPRDNHAILHLRGEFDTYYVPLLQKEIDDLAKAGIVRVVLNLRLVKFINSTALGAIIKASKSLAPKGGKLALSRPSAFCRDIIEKVGLDRVVGVFETDEAAVESFEQSKALPKKAVEDLGDESSSVLFTPLDESRIQHFLTQSQLIVKTPMSQSKPTSAWSGAGRMSALDEHGMRFTWNGGHTGLSPFAMAQMLSIGTEWKVKFRLPLLQRGYCEAVAVVDEVEERPEGVKVGASFKAIDDTTRKAIQQYAKDLAFLKEELKRATDRK